MHSNPIGTFGMRQLLQSINNNQNTKFKINLKDISADKEIMKVDNMKNKALNFDPSNPEGNYTLDLVESFDQVCLQNLLQAAERAVTRNEAAFEIKSCFSGVKLNGKPKWDPPLEKFKNGLFNLGDEPSGELVFNFTLNPIALKEQEKAIKKATEAGDQKLLKRL